MVDLLTAVEGAHRSTETEGACPQTTELYELAALTLSPRLTCEARLLADEPWSKDVGVYDARLAPHLLTSDNPLREVQDAIAAGRLSLEHPLFSEPPRYDIDLLRCPLRPSTILGLRQAGLTKLSALACLTPRDLLARNRLGVQSVSELLVLLDVFRYFTPAAQPVGREPALSDLCEAVVSRSRDCWFPERLADRIARRVHLAFATSRWRWRTSCRSLPPLQASPTKTSRLNTSGGTVMALEHWKWRGPPVA